MEQVSAKSVDVDGEEIFAALRRLVDSLPDTQREVVMLRYFSDCSSREIGTLLDMSAAAVRKQLERARKQLGRKMLEQASNKFEWDRDLAKKTLALVAASSTAWMGSQASAAAGMAAGGLGGFASLAAKGVAVLLAVGAGLVALEWLSGNSDTDAKIGRAHV